MAKPDDQPGQAPKTSPDAPTDIYGSPDLPGFPPLTSTAAASAKPARDKFSPRYEVLSELGKGGMGVVYKARDTETGEIVALKALRADIASNQSVIERFKRELVLARKITHKNVCRTHELMRFGDEVVIAMEFVEGESLREVLRRFGNLSIKKGTQVAVQLCEGLAEAHGQGIVHRDLKPENIMIDRDGNAKIMDFGIAYSGDSSVTATGAVIGTPAHMSPEQMQGSEVDQRTDIYALGLILYEMFTGRAVFSGNSPVEVALKQAREVPPNPSDLEPTVGSRLDHTIRKCLERNPASRFSTVVEVRGWLLNDKSTAEPEVSFTPPDAWVKADWIVVVAGTLALLAFTISFIHSNPAAWFKVRVDKTIVSKIASDYLRRLSGVNADPVEVDASSCDRRLASFLGEEGSLRSGNPAIPVRTWFARWEKPNTWIGLDDTGQLRFFSQTINRPDMKPSLENPEAEGLRIIREFLGAQHEDLRLVVKGSWTSADGATHHRFEWESKKSALGLGKSFSATFTDGSLEYLATSYKVPDSYRVDEAKNWSTAGIILFYLPLLIYGATRLRFASLSVTWRLQLTLVFALIAAWFSFRSSWELKFIVQNIFLAGVGAGAACFVGLIGAEHLFAKTFPTKFQLKQWLEGRGWALPTIRGVFLGFVLLGLDATLAMVANEFVGARPDSDFFFRWFTDFTELGFPGIQLLFVAMLWAGVSAGIVGLSSAVSFGMIKNGWLAFGIATVLAAATDGHMHLGNVQPASVKILVLGLDCGLMVLIFRRYDLLTLFVAAYTAAFVGINYAFTQVFKDLGNSSQYTAFGLWLSLVLLALVTLTAPWLRRPFERFA